MKSVTLCLALLIALVKAEDNCWAQEFGYDW